jgi:hypothetical protein
MRTFGRIALVLLAASCIVIGTAVVRHLRDEFPDRRPGLILKRENSLPKPDRLPNFIGQFVLMALIATGGRVILRLRLSDSRRR